MMQQALVPYDFQLQEKEKDQLPINIGIGKTWTHPTLLSQYLKKENQTSKEKAISMQLAHYASLMKLF